MTGLRTGAWRRYAAPFVLGSVLLAACAGTQETFDRNVQLFDELAFGGPFDSDMRQNKRLTKWTGDLHVAVVGDSGDRHGPQLKAALGKVAALTGLRVRFQPARNAETNYLVRFVRRKRIAVRNEHVGCLVNTWERDGRIYRALVTISTAEEAQVPRCIAHETMHSIGFPFHSGVVRSILSPVHNEQGFTAWDELMLRTLYDARLTPNMVRANAMVVARTIIGTALAQR